MFKAMTPRKLFAVVMLAGGCEAAPPSQATPPEPVQSATPTVPIAQPTPPAPAPQPTSPPTAQPSPTPTQPAPAPALAARPAVARPRVTAAGRPACGNVASRSATPCKETQPATPPAPGSKP